MLDPALERAMALHQAGQLAQAEAWYRSILAKNPDDANAASYLGVLLHQLRRNDEAIPLLHHAARIAPDSVSILSNLGMVLAAARQLPAAEYALRAAISIQPDFVPALLNLGKVLLLRDQYPAAFDAYRAVARKVHASHEAWCGIGDTYQAMHQFEPAKLAYQKAIELQDSPAARLGLASTYLLSGDLLRGWPLYEARWEATGRSPSAGFDQPKWDGSYLEGKTILLHAEQGLGDTIQFIRFAPWVKERGGRTIVLVPPALASLLEGAPGIDQVATDRDQIGAFDVQCSLLSLPGVFQITIQSIPNSIPYLAADATKSAAWKARFALPRPVVGIAWAGSAEHENDLNRSVPFGVLQPLLGTPGVHWVSLQIERREQDGALIDWTSDLHDLSDTAALITNLDLVITVDTAVAHLAGALGKPTWLLLPYAPDWRWMWDRENSPWYPTMRLFRQQTPGDWSSPIQRVAEALHQLRHI
jgi:tetratricopeptide (TPR) repeat protein